MRLNCILRGISQCFNILPYLTCHIIIYYMALIILKELLGTVLWIYIKRYKSMFQYFAISDMSYYYLLHGPYYTQRATGDGALDLY